MKTRLIILFVGIFVCMTYATVIATLDRGVFTAGRDLWPDRWFRATLLDAYCGFLTFYVWVAYKESWWLPRSIWFVLIMLLGNFAMSGYVLWQIVKLKEFSWERLLLHENIRAVSQHKR